ncbi:bifunctional diaminohydroxyphosphoribosylaminopyrimidine deaminase/5-amino-6-(5-phosphoribosylamino)uracil reductase RibD [Paracoccus sp. 11-3]|uniref:Riboflavin biosynthesis protein RibD n=2 Tax=Paracoccus amoyensis TaxID=2760093 RepID=A0A926GBD7_9RHOB|nr:bifunctional diaminohydroxyphosphoribosylaminopyrimidine deaminase/5-amino-6-(5-phosphoribosylamino)uracil reductase RibD [Paracoccus amoyensis]MBC9245955.1 bifunctional diaminohydroxyphosphoribosylaminopyrimidine deaminase/5-amino-6-(5-phosphoribosylamino)uracil reductase RibD [Paracoccus amoyensis]
MAHALRLSQRGLGNVWPNPAVGCVIVRDGVIVGRGWTQSGGRPHAERVALDQAGVLARDATAYVTLEPCAHIGKTPPCAVGLVEAGVKRVVSAMTDPDPRVAGRGHAILRDAGVEVVEGVSEDRARALQAGFLSRVTHGRPFVTLKLASSFDGRIATADGESQWITGPLARQHVHAMRMTHDAIMVGGGTARADLPALNVRGFHTPTQPVRIIASSRALPDLAAEGAEHGAIWQVSGAVDNIMTDLAARGITRLFCEGGGVLAASLLRADMVDQVMGYTAGVMIGADGRASIGSLALQHLSDAPRFDLAETCPIGPDLFHRWVRRQD